MICITLRISVLFKITRISKLFLSSITDVYFPKHNYFFSQNIMIERLGLEEET